MERTAASRQHRAALTIHSVARRVTGLPRAAYCSSEWLEREHERIFDDCWTFVGMADDLSGAEQYLTAEVGRHPVVLVRDAEGELRAFHNICRHRGARVVEGRGGVDGGRLTCPYHRWMYGLDGRLLAVPQARTFDCELDRARLGLLPAAVAVWNGMVFVHPRADAPPFEEWLADLPQHLSPHDPGALVDLGRHTFEVGANWKIFVENALDGYHLEYVHAHTLADYDHRRQEQHLCGPHWAFREPLAEGQSEVGRAEIGSGRAPIPGIVAPWNGQSGMLLFPAFVVFAGPTFWLAARVVPLAPDRSRVEVILRGMPTRHAAARKTGAVIERLSQRLRALFAAVRSGRIDNSQLREAFRRDYSIAEEDIFCMESVQRATQSPHFRIGALSAQYELGIAHFHDQVRSMLGALDHTT